MSKIAEVPPAFTANELAYQLEIKKLRQEMKEVTDYNASVEEFVEELKQNVENLKKATTIKDEAYYELLGKYQKLKSNPPRQTSQLYDHAAIQTEEAVTLIPLIQEQVRWLNNHMDKIIIDEIEHGGWFDERVQKVVKEMTFELSDPTVEIN